jgi:hypothetical protein
MAPQAIEIAQNGLGMAIHGIAIVKNKNRLGELLSLRPPLRAVNAPSTPHPFVPG